MAHDNASTTREPVGAGSFDTVVIGGGPAGLSGALTLGRARRSVLVVDDGRPRNAPADGVHVFLTREGTPPQELLEQGRAEVAGYGGAFAQGTVTGVAGSVDTGFTVRLGDGTAVRAARLLITTGLSDGLPDVPGLADRWGRDVLHCPYCHGWEVRDQAVGIVATGPMAVHQALLWRQWTDDVVVFRHTAGAFSAEDEEKFAARRITVVEGAVTGLAVEGDRLTGARLEDGRTVARQALAVATHMGARAGFLDDLGLHPEDREMAGHVIGTALPVDASGATAVPGVWAAGNVVDPAAQVIGSAAAGVRAGGLINADLVNEETRRAVEERRERAAVG